MKQTMFRNGFWTRSELTASLWVFRREFAIVGLFSVVINVLMLAPTLFMLQVYDRILVSRSELTLLAMSLLTLFFFVVAAFAEGSRTSLLVRTGTRLDSLLNARVFNASFMAALNPSGASPERSLSDLTEIRQFLTGQAIFAFFDAPWTPIYMVVLFFLHPILGWVAIGFAAVQIALVWLGHARILAPVQALALTSNQSSAYLRSKLRNVEVAESMGMAGHLRGRWLQRHQTYMDQHGIAHEMTHRVAAWSKFVRYSQQSLALCAGALLVIEGQLSVGAMIAATVLMSRALSPIDQMVGVWRSWIGARSAFNRLENLLQSQPEQKTLSPVQGPAGAIHLENVFATAQGRVEPILQGVTLQAKPGTVTVVMGPSGSGKSTLARVILGIWPDVKGAVLLNGIAIADWSRVELGPHLGYLPQDVELFNGSIAENISRFAKVNSAKVIAAAQSAGLHELILRFPNGYDTLIGEGGNLLSGGLRQRIGLARALLGEPALIVLDEPNANLDEPGELALIQAVRELKAKGKTVILITHRPGVLDLADQVLLLQNGRVQHQNPPEAAVAPQPTVQRLLPETSN